MPSARKGFRDRWLRLVIGSGKKRFGPYPGVHLDGETRALLIVIAQDYMNDAGRFSVLRTDLAARFGVDKRRITERIGRAVDAGLLMRTSGGWNSRAAEYESLMPTPLDARASPVSERTEKVAESAVPSNGEGGGPDTPFRRHLRSALQGAKVAAQTDPERACVTHESHATIASTSFSGDLPSDEQDQERSDEDPALPTAYAVASRPDADCHGCQVEFVFPTQKCCIHTRGEHAAS